MSVSVDRKPERAVQAKVRDIKQKNHPDRLKTRKGGLYKVKDKKKRQSNCIQ